MAKAAFNKTKKLFTSKVDLNLRKKLVKCYIWSVALYQQSGPKFEEETSEMLHLERGFVWC
jgi:hypothetical protein